MPRKPARTVLQIATETTVGRIVKRHPEAAEQRLFIKQWRMDPRTRDLPACAVPNGGYRNKREAALMKGEGVDRGVPDWLLFQSGEMAPHVSGEMETERVRRTGRHIGLALEFKSPTGGGKVSADQKRWHDNLSARGWRVEVVTSAWQAWQVVRDYLSLGAP